MDVATALSPTRICIISEDEVTIFGQEWSGWSAELSVYASSFVDQYNFTHRNYTASFQIG